MSKVQISFDLPEEKFEYQQTMYAEVALSAIRELRRHIRSRRKYADLSTEAYEELEKVSNILYEMCEDIPEDLL